MIERDDTEVVGTLETPTVEPENAVPEESAAVTPARQPRRPIRSLLARSGPAVWLGLLFLGAGFGLLAYTWSRVASTLDISAQLTYIVSGGFTGLAVVLVGLTLIIVATRRGAREERVRQMLELRDTLRELGEAIDRLRPPD